MAIESKEQKSKATKWSATQVYNACEKMQTVERARANDRALINNQFNGGRPYTAEEAKVNQIHINVNWLEGQRILITAINQLNDALIFKERFFTAIPKECPPEKKDEFSDKFTANIHEHLKNGLSGMRQMFLLKSRNASVALHGIGPILWMNDFRWRGRYIPIEDLLIPTDALCDFSNLMFFAVNLYLTAGEFFDMTYADDEVDKHWNKPAVMKILQDLTADGQQQSSGWDYRDRPEQWIEWLKQNRCMWDLDAAATVKVRMFFYKDPKTKKWFRCMMLKEGTQNVPADNQFIYDGRDTPFADSISEIMHVQYGDNSIVAPLKYHSVRGLGVMLFAPVECNNRLRCETVQHVLLSMKTWLRINNPADRDRPKQMDMVGSYGVLNDGVSVVPNTERHQIDPRLVEMAMSQMRQIMSESGSSYVQNVESGQSAQPRTAKEIGVLENQANVQVSAMLQSMYGQEEFYWQEEVRRFLRENSEDPEVEEFRQKCIADGIPKQLLVAKNWTVKVERVLGAGDNLQANQEADGLLSQSQRFDPAAQRIILRKWTTVKTRDPKMGELLVPEDPNKVTQGEIEAENIFGTLMDGIPVKPREGIERTSYIEALLSMTNEKIQQITQAEGVPSAAEIVGLKTCLNHIQQNIQILQPDINRKQQVKQYTDLLSQISNEVKMLAERFSEQQKADNPQADPTVQAKVQGMQMQAQTKQQIAQATAQQKMAHKEAEFEQKMAHMVQEFQAKMEAMIAQTRADILSDAAKTGAEIKHSRARADAVPAKAGK